MGIAENRLYYAFLGNYQVVTRFYDMGAFQFLLDYCVEKLPWYLNIYTVRKIKWTNR